VKRPAHTTGDVARALGESTITVQRLIKSGLLKAVRWGRQWRIEADEFKFYKPQGRAGLERRAGK